MAGFSGFSEEEIQGFRMQRADLNETRKSEPIKKAVMNSSGGKRSKPRQKIRTKSNRSESSDRSQTSTVTDTKESESTIESRQELVVAKEEKIIQEKTREVEVIMEPEKIKEIELSNLEKMQQRQKEMEMINKKKEKMVQIALKQRYAKTKRETETLKLVQKELSHLDNLLYSDVQVLRDKIDCACRDFDAARKRYDRAEAEYINAKVNLHAKTELKDQLTEHLCSIIQQNEERKAKKLAELMAKLELEDQESNLNEVENPPEDLPEETTCQTEKNSTFCQNNGTADENVVCDVKDTNEQNRKDEIKIQTKNEDRTLESKVDDEVV